MTENFVKIYYSFDIKVNAEERSECAINVNEMPRIVNVKPNNIPALEWIAEHLVHEYGVGNGARVYLWDQEQTYLGCVDVDVINVPRYFSQYVEETEE